MSDEWIITQSGAVRKSEINMILIQPSEDGTKNIVLVNKDNLSFLVYNNIENDYTAIVIIDNLIREFDPKHIPRVDISKKQEEDKEKEISSTDDDVE